MHPPPPRNRGAYPLHSARGNASCKIRRIQRGIRTSGGWVRHDQAWLWSLDGHDADVRDVVAFLERWHGVNVKNDACDRRARLGDRFTKEVGDSAEFHPRFHVRATLDERIKNAELVSEDVNDFFEPYGILNE